MGKQCDCQSDQECSCGCDCECGGDTGSFQRRYQTKADHLVAVDALDANGSVVKEQPLRP